MSENLITTDEETHMRGEGWKKEITLKHVETRRDGVICQEYDFYATRMPCHIREGGIDGPECGIEHTWIKIVHGKIFWSCFRHKATQGPISLSRGVRYAEYPITASQAVEISQETGQEIPRDVITLFQREKSGQYAAKRPSE